MEGGRSSSVGAKEGRGPMAGPGLKGWGRQGAAGDGHRAGGGRAQARRGRIGMEARDSWNVGGEFRMGGHEADGAST